MEVERGNWLRECELSGEDWRYADLAGFNVHVRGYNGTSSVIDTLALRRMGIVNAECMEPPVTNNTPSCAS